MIQEENNVMVVDATKKENDTTSLSVTEKGDNLLVLAEEAAARVTALKKIMTACLGVTTPKDWVIISGSPYLQESGCTKVANIIGVSFEIVPGFPTVEVDDRGYKTFTFRVRAFGKSTYVEGEGQRSMSEDFFCKTNNGIKQPEQINERDVRISALTNAKANAIKSIFPGLKNIDIETLDAAGIDTTKISGYTHRTGSQGGRTGTEQEFVCEKCGKKVSGTVASYSKARHGHILCVDCQNKVGRIE